MKVIFYGAGAWLARNLRRLLNSGYEPVCVCDADQQKWRKPFGGHAALEVLPLHEAAAKFTDCEIYVTVDDNSKGTILRYLTAECGIDEKRIANWAPIEYRLGCNDLETTIKFRSKRVFVRCYWRHPGIDRTGDVAEDVRRFGQWRNQTIQAVRDGKPTPCDGCENLKYGWYLAERKLTSLQVSESDEHSFCNFNCCYCFTKARNRNLGSAKLSGSEQDEQLDVLRHVSKEMGDRELELQFSTGELTVHPHRDEILELFQGYETVLFTNASIYNDQIAELMRQGLLTIVTSMDSGTPETFQRIKSVDCHAEVCANLARYAATGGCVILKYIMLSGINDNDADVDGFVDLATRLRAVIQLSNDTRTRRAPLPENALRATCRMAARAREENILVVHEREVFAESDNDTINNAATNPVSKHASFSSFACCLQE